MAKSTGKLNVKLNVITEYVHRVDGQPNSLFVMKLDCHLPPLTVANIHRAVEAELNKYYPDSTLIILPPEVAGIQSVSEADLNEAGFFKKDD